MKKFKDFLEQMEEGKRGLWDNIHAKRKRIASGSGERMRKPGSKGAPTAANLKAAAESFEQNFSELEEAVNSIDKGEYDYEGLMARTQLQTILRNSTDLIDMLSDQENMPEWIQSKITLSQDYISTVRDYLHSVKELNKK
jgi:exonuclease VII small subunit